jgi:hypothetical protein
MEMSRLSEDRPTGQTGWHAKNLTLTFARGANSWKGRGPASRFSATPGSPCRASMQLVGAVRSHRRMAYREASGWLVFVHARVDQLDLGTTRSWADEFAGGWCGRR